MNRRVFLGWGVIGGGATLLASFFLEPTARLWRKAYDYYCRQPYLKSPSPAPAVPGQSDVFHVTEVPVPVWDTPYRPGLDALLALMARENLSLYQMDDVAPLAGPDGLVAPNDVVLLKVNSQWAERGMTSTDLVRGLIQRLVDHPAGFSGEIVAETDQPAGPQGARLYGYHRRGEELCWRYVPLCGRIRTGRRLGFSRQLLPLVEGKPGWLAGHGNDDAFSGCDDHGCDLRQSAFQLGGLV
jgi:hypothetical protein